MAIIICKYAYYTSVYFSAANQSSFLIHGIRLPKLIGNMWNGSKTFIERSPDSYREHRLNGFFSHYRQHNTADTLVLRHCYSA